MTDLSNDLLKVILAGVGNTLRTRAKLARVCRAFASGIREQTSVTVFSSDLAGAQHGSKWGARKDPTFKHITHLSIEGSDLKRATVARMFTLVTFCPKLQSLSLQLMSVHSERPSETLLALHLWLLFSQNSDSVPSLQKLVVKGGDQLKLLMDAKEGVLCSENVLTSVTAGSVDVLRALAHCAAGGSSSLFSSCCTSQSDQSMLSMMPALESLDIGDSPFFATFAGTVRGCLSLDTAKTLRQASLVHCTGVLSEWGLQRVTCIPSIKSWSSVRALRSDTTLIEHFAPQLETLNLNIVCLRAAALPSCTDVWLTPVMKCIDVTLCPPGQTLRLRGSLASSLTHMCVKAYRLIVSKTLYDWVLARRPIQTGLHGTHCVVATPIGSLVYVTAVKASPVILQC